jgi:hypothetical protein
MSEEMFESRPASADNTDGEERVPENLECAPALEAVAKGQAPSFMDDVVEIADPQYAKSALAAQQWDDEAKTQTRRELEALDRRSRSERSALRNQTPPPTMELDPPEFQSELQPDLSRVEELLQLIESAGWRELRPRAFRLKGRLTNLINHHAGRGYHKRHLLLALKLARETQDSSEEWQALEELLFWELDAGAGNESVFWSRRQDSLIRTLKRQCSV